MLLFFFNLYTTILERLAKEESFSVSIPWRENQLQGRNNSRKGL